jgi:hypothetical protein
MKHIGNSKIEIPEAIPRSNSIVNDGLNSAFTSVLSSSFLDAVALPSSSSSSSIPSSPHGEAHEHRKRERVCATKSSGSLLFP